MGLTMEKALTTLRKMQVIQLPEPYVFCPAPLPATPLPLPVSPSPGDGRQIWGTPRITRAGNSWQGRTQVPGKLTPQQEVCLQGRHGVALMPPAVALVTSWAQPALHPIPTVQRLGTWGP